MATSVVCKQKAAAPSPVERWQTIALGSGGSWFGGHGDRRRVACIHRRGVVHTGEHHDRQHYSRANQNSDDGVAVHSCAPELAKMGTTHPPLKGSRIETVRQSELWFEPLIEPDADSNLEAALSPPRQ